ncbi:response regulator [Ornithinibacillus bavariensis]|uniref:Chemotaxis protein CheY n=1 Tax=Ornithinibacillus bavariensis TaxID=545502 RepID=A0A919XAC4_9BACI|nr:response regulator [Ornithinibacillus bavariensis]GIO27035.1 chemotaxis protein CheY [Ornithinibacillus bavariensis]HAM80108.1 two-component system response regulator [Ornithinibacillus sp.]
MAKVLITDDAAFMRMQLKDIVTKLGHEVVGEAENGRIAIEQAKELQPDLITMDITMPELNGVEATREIKKLLPGVKIIMCSAMGQQGMVVDAIQAGANDFVVKPFNLDRIKESFAKVLS